MLTYLFMTYIIHANSHQLYYTHPDWVLFNYILQSNKPIFNSSVLSFFWKFLFFSLLIWHLFSNFNMLSNVHNFHRLYFLKANPILLSEKVFLKVLNIIFLSILVAKNFKFIFLKVIKKRLFVFQFSQLLYTWINNKYCGHL